MSRFDPKLQRLNPACTGNIFVDTCEGGMILEVEVQNNNVSHNPADYYAKIGGASASDIASYVLATQNGYGCARVDFVPVNRPSSLMSTQARPDDPVKLGYPNSILLPYELIVVSLFISILLTIAWFVFSP